MSERQPYAIGIDVGGANIKTVAVSMEGVLLFQSQQPTEETQSAWAGYGPLSERSRPGKAVRPAISDWPPPVCPPPDGRSIAWMQGRMESLQGLDWTNYLKSSRVIPVLNDAQAALLGETWQGAAAGCRNVVLLTLGTGVGGGAMVDGHLLRGRIGRAGHLGHISLDPNGPTDIVGTPGSLEDAIGNCTVRQRTGGRFASTEQLVEAHRDGDPEATIVWLRSIHALAAGMVSLINVLDPEVFILGGGIMHSGDALLTPLLGLLDRWEWRPQGSRVRIVTASLGEMAGAWGAAYNALRP